MLRLAEGCIAVVSPPLGWLVDRKTKAARHRAARRRSDDPEDDADANGGDDDGDGDGGASDDGGGSASRDGGGWSLAKVCVAVGGDVAHLQKEDVAPQKPHPSPRRVTDAHDAREAARRRSGRLPARLGRARRRARARDSSGYAEWLGRSSASQYYLDTRHVISRCARRARARDFPEVPRR